MSLLIESLAPLIAASDSAACIVDRSLNVVACNSAFHERCNKLSGGTLRSAPAKIQQLWPKLANADLRKAARQDLRLSGSAASVTARVLDEEYVILYVTMPVETVEAGRTLHQQRLQTLGELSGGVAHDFNNMLTGILGHVAYLKAILPAAGQHVESLVAIEHGARKAADLTQQILHFAKFETSGEGVPVDLCELARKTCVLLRRTISPEYRFEVDIPQVPLFVRGMEGHLAQILVNLVVNARDAITANGSIRIALTEVDGGAGRQAVLSVVDNGCGMTDEVRQRIFEPYFSTKREKGTGLGLATVRSIIDAYGGSIVVHSKPGSGTTMEVMLPCIDAKPQPIQDEGMQERLRGNERVLVVDDEHPVRTVLYLGLAQLGYEVEIAEGGEDAIKRYERGERFDLVILDMLMPKVSGDKVFARIRELDPDARVLICSGYSSETTIRKLLADGSVGFIAKPFTIEDLAKRIREALGL